MASSKVTKFSCLVLKKRGDGFDGVAIPQSLREWVFGQRDVGRSFVVPQGGLEKL